MNKLQILFLFIFTTIFIIFFILLFLYNELKYNCDNGCFINDVIKLYFQKQNRDKLIYYGKEYRYQMNYDEI